MADENTPQEIGSLITDSVENTKTDSETVVETKPELTPGEKTDAENQKVFYGDSKEEAENKESSSEKSRDEDKKGADQNKSDSDDESGKKTDDEVKEDKENKDVKLDEVEDNVLTDADMERIESLIKDQGLSKEAGQKLAQEINDQRSEFVEGLKTQLTEKVEEWTQQTKSDKELGGEKFDESIQNAKLALKKFGTDELLRSLHSSGFGSNPEVVRVFARIGKAIGPDDLIHGGGTSKVHKSMEEVFYGKQEN